MGNPVDVASITLEKPLKVVEGIHFYEEKDYNEWFEQAYNQTEEPWNYSKRGGELYRLKYSVAKIKKYNPNPKILLELGSSRGLMTEDFVTFCDTVIASDISPTALKTCKARCNPIAEKNNCQIEYFGTSTPCLPFAENSFDVVTVCDGLFGWWFSEEKRTAAVEDINRVLKPGGIAIFTDCLTQLSDKELFKLMIINAPMTTLEVGYLYDKPWYKLEGLFKKLKINNLFGGFLASIPIAKALNSIGSLLGVRASWHIYAVLKKPL